MNRAFQIDKEITLEKLQRELNNFFDNNQPMLQEWLDTKINRLDGECPRHFFDTNERRTILYEVIQEMKYGDMM
jgi:hypothetical protein